MPKIVAAAEISPSSVKTVALTSVEKSPRSDDDDSVISMPRSRASMSALTMLTPLSSADAISPEVNAAEISFVFFVAASPRYINFAALMRDDFLS